MKEYQAEGRAIDVIERALPVLEGIRKKWDVAEDDLAAMRDIDHDIFRIVIAHCGAGTPVGAVEVIDRLHGSVINPIRSLGYLPTGGEQHGNMLCVESEIYRMNNYLTNIAPRA